MSRRRGYYGSGNSLVNNLKDYIVPIIGGILILVLIWSIFFSGNDNSNKKPDNENKIGMEISLSASDKAKITYSGGNSSEVTPDTKLYKGEKISISDGRAVISNENISLNLNKLGELTYLENGGFALSTGEVWVDNKTATNVDMKFAKLKISADSHVSLSQNEVNSTIYVVNGTVEVANLAGKSTVLSSMDKIEVSRAEASEEKLNIAGKKEVVDDYFINSDWFTINKGAEYLKKEEEKTGSGQTGAEETSSGTTVSSTPKNLNSYITFSNLSDQASVSDSSINISGAYDTEKVGFISVNGKNAVLNTEAGTFKIENVDVSAKENDLVFKVLAPDENLINKFVYTVYYSAGTDSGTFKSNNYDVDGSKFAFTAPTTGATYTTYEDFITIRGSVSYPGIDTVTVNDFTLQSFNGSTWRYHARDIYDTLSNGTNVYEVKYFSNGKLVYKNYFTIVKKTYGNTQTNNNENTVNTSANNATGATE